MPTDKPQPGAHDKPVLVYTTFPDAGSAEVAANALVEARLVACANIIAGMTAIYLWQGERHRDAEVVMILKTRAGLLEQVITAIRARHPYDNPAISAVDVVGGSADYLAWVMAQTAALSDQDLAATGATL